MIIIVFMDTRTMEMERKNETNEMKGVEIVESSLDRAVID